MGMRVQKCPWILYGCVVSPFSAHFGGAPLEIIISKRQKRRNHQIVPLEHQVPPLWCSQAQPRGVGCCWASNEAPLQHGPRWAPHAPRGLGLPQLWRSQLCKKHTVSKVWSGDPGSAKWKAFDRIKIQKPS